MHASTTNHEIEDLLATVRPHYRAQKLLGAGGGGYGFFISPTRESASHLRESLSSWAASRGNTRARVVDLSLNETGLHVTVS